MSQQLILQLGRETRLALAEAAAVLGEQAKLVAGSRQTAIVEIPESSQPAELQERLAGVIKVGRYLSELAQGAGPNQIGEAIFTDLSRRPVRDFGISVLDGPWQTSDRDRLGLAIKKQIRRQGGSARFVSGSEAQLSSVLVADQLLPRGREYLIIWADQRIIIAETITVQAWKKWSTRDYDRPSRDAKRGMLPPKFARIMINLGQFDRETIIYDPFCGVGTVLQEAALSGYQRLIGSDRDELAIQASQKNLAWLRSWQPSLSFQLELKRISAEQLPNLADPRQGKPLGIVTEADLGSPELARRTPLARKEQFLALQDRYQRWLTDLYRFVRTTERCVLAFPHLRDPEVALPLTKVAETIGWRILPPFPLDWQHHPAAGPTLSYARPDQLIGRDLLMVEKP